jgi:hypothetical protein
MDLEVLSAHPPDFCSKPSIPPGALGHQRRVGQPRRMGTAGRRSDRKNPADRLDPVFVAPRKALGSSMNIFISS